MVHEVLMQLGVICQNPLIREDHLPYHREFTEERENKYNARI